MPTENSSKNGNQSHKTPKESKINGEEESSNSEGESSYYEEEESERRKVDCLDDMQFLEQQFSDLKELYYHEMVQEIDQKIQFVNQESAPEYLQQLKELEESLQSHVETAELQHKCRIKNVENKYAEEVQSTHQDFEELCKVTLARMRSEVEEKSRRLQEERIMAALTSESFSRKRKAKVSEFLLPEKRKKPVSVTGPCVIYMLRDMDIMEDLNDIRRGRAAVEVQRNEGPVSGSLKLKLEVAALLSRRCIV